MFFGTSPFTTPNPPNNTELGLVSEYSCRYQITQDFFVYLLLDPSGLEVGTNLLSIVRRGASNIFHNKLHRYLHQD
jgi:hypothetical protein